MEDSPPTYSEAIADIEKERSRQLTQNSQTSRNHYSSRSFGDVRHRPSNDTTEPDEPPPPYSEHYLHQVPPYSPDDCNHGDEFNDSSHGDNSHHDGILTSNRILPPDDSSRDNTENESNEMYVDLKDNEPSTQSPYSGPCYVPTAPYSEHYIPSAPPITPGHSSHGNDLTDNTFDDHNETNSFSNIGLTLPSSASCVTPYDNERVRSHGKSLDKESDSDGSELGATGYTKPEKEQSKFDLTLPGPIFLEETDIAITSDSPPFKEIKWPIPENAGDFAHLIYVAEFKTSVEPNVVTPFVDWWPKFHSRTWYSLLETATPSFRIFHSGWKLMFGPVLKWEKEDIIKSSDPRIYIRIRAVDEFNRLPTCKKGPWSDEITITYTDMNDPWTILGRMKKKS